MKYDSLLSPLIIFDAIIIKKKYPTWYFKILHGYEQPIDREVWYLISQGFPYCVPERAAGLPRGFKMYPYA